MLSQLLKVAKDSGMKELQLSVERSNEASAVIKIIPAGAGLCPETLLST